MGSSLCAAFSLLFVRELSQEVWPEAILLVRLLPSGIVLLMFVKIQDRCGWRTDRKGITLSLILGTLLFFELWLILFLFKANTLVAVAPFLFLIPLFTFLLSLYPFKLRRFDQISWYELGGMALIIGALAVTEAGQK